MTQEAADEVDMLAADIEGKLTAKDIVAWKEAVASYVRSAIFPRKQWVKDNEIRSLPAHLLSITSPASSIGPKHAPWY